jgi:outer membrane protein TolC
MKNILKYITLNVSLILLIGLNLGFSQQQITLREVIDISLKNNLDIQISKNNEKISNINNYIGVAGGLPTVLATANTNEQVIGLNQELSNGTIINRKGVVSNNSNVGLTASMLLYNGGRVLATKKRLGELQRLSQEQLNSTVQNAIADVMLKYYSVVQQQNFQSTLKQSIEVSKQRLALIEARRSVGLLGDSEYLQAQLDLNNQTQALQVQDIVIKQSKDDLLRTMVLSPNTEIVVKDTIVVDEVMPWENIEVNLKKNPDVLAADIQININKIIERETNARRFPAVTVNTGFNYLINQSSAGFTLLNQNYGPFLGMGVTMPIHTGSANVRQVQVAKVNTQNAKLQRDIIDQNFQNAAAKSWEVYTSNIKLIESEQKNYLLAQKLLNLITQKFQLGNATIVDIIIAQQSFENSGYRLNNLSYNAKVAEITLKQIGNLLGK